MNPFFVAHITYISYNEKDMKNKKFKAILSVIGYFLLVMAVCISAGFIFHAQYYDSIYVSGISMSPTLNGAENEKAGSVVDFGIMDSHNSALKHIKRFSIVSTYYPDEIDYDLTTGKLRATAKQKIKRIIALPGESFKIENSKLYVNGEYIPYTFNINPKIENGYTGKDINREDQPLGEDEYWVLGDNRSNSRDSGALNLAIKKENLVGVLVAIEGTAQLKVKNYRCDFCGKTYSKQPSLCGKCSGGSFSVQYDLINKKYTWPKYF